LVKVLQDFTFSEEGVTKEIEVMLIIGNNNDDMDPNDITKSLNIQPTNSWKKGEEYVGKAFDPQKRIVIEVLRRRPNSVWVINTATKIRSKKVSDHLSYLDRLLTPKLPIIKRIIDPEDVFATLSITKTAFPYGAHYDVDSRLMLRCCELCKEIAFANYESLEDNSSEESQ